MPPSEDRSNGITSPFGSRKSDSRSSSNTYRTSKDERKSEERRPDERSRFGRPENSSHTQNHSSPRIPSGPRALNSMSRPTPANPERISIATNSKPRMDNTLDPGPGQARSPQGILAVDSVNSDATQYLRLDAYQEAYASVSRLGEQLTDLVALKFEREKAKKSYEQKEANYDKTSVNHKTYPAIEQHQNKTLAKAKGVFERAEGKFAEKQMEMAKTYELMAARMVSGGVDTGGISSEQQMFRDKLNDLEIRFESRFKTQDDEILKMKDKILTIDRDVRRDFELRQKEVSSIRDELSNIRAKAVGNETSIQREDQKTAITALESRIDVEMARLREETTNIRKTLQKSFEDLHTGPLRSLEQKFDLADQESKRKDPQREEDHKLILKHVDLHNQHIHSQEQASEIFKSIGDDTVKLSGRMAVIEDTTTKLQSVVIKREAAAKSDHKSLADDIAGFRKRVEILELRPSRPHSNRSTTAKSSVVAGTASEEQEVKIDELISKIGNMKSDFEQLQTNISQRFDKFQEDSDEIYAPAIDELNLKISPLIMQFTSLKSAVDALAAKQLTSETKQSTLESNLETIKEQHSNDVQELAAHQANQWTMQSGGLQNLQKEIQALKQVSRPAEPASNYAQNTSGFVHQTGSPVVSNSSAAQGRQSGSPIVNAPDTPLLSSKQILNKLDAVEMGLFHLNTRFNNLTTDALARQMWSQLDNVHPNLKDATKGLSRFEHTLQTHDGQFFQIHQKIDKIETRSHGLPPALKEALEKVDQDVTAQRNRTDDLVIRTRSIQDQIDSIRGNPAVKSDLVAKVLPTQSNGASVSDESSSDGGTHKRKASSDAPNGNSKRLKQVIADLDDSGEDQGNGHSDTHSPR